MAKVNKEAFVNPFETGINYKTFLDAIPEKTSVKDYCKDNLTDDQIEFLENDLKHYNNNLKNK
jgi:hypothetical protein